MKLIFTFFILITGSSLYAQKLSVQNLKCDYRTNPLGVDKTAPAFAWQLVSAEKNVLQTACQILVSDDSLLLKKNIGNTWDSKKLQSSTSIQVAYKGKPLQPAKKYYWKVIVWDNKGNISTSNINYWQMGLLAQNDWNNAQWIAYEELPDTSKIIPHVHQSGKKAWGKRKDILPMLRKEFAVTKQVKSATVFVSGLGHFEMTINGRKIGDNFLDPGWTNYTKQALYVTFDVTQNLTVGSNAVGVMLGNGFYYIPSERYRKMTGAYGYPKMICRLLVEYTDGTTENIVSDQSWRAAPSPTFFSSIYGGEDYDANLEQAGWDKPGFKDSHWKKAVVVTGHPLESQTAAPLKVMQTFAPVKTTKLRDSVWVYDVAQNMSGIPEITVRGKKGDTVKIYTAELLKENGSANQQATGSPSYYQYVLKGNGEETWHPHFTFYGFRYIQVENAVPAGQSNPNGMPVLLAVKGLHTSNSAERIGAFSCSSDLFNKTDKLIDWSIKSNMASVFMDCPHREKIGWLEETHLVGSSVKYAYDIATLCRKAVTDMRLTQTPEGLVPEIAPEFVQFTEPFRDSPEWGIASILVPWYMYQWYGDKEVLTGNYNMMQRYLTYLQGKDSSRILKQGLGDWFDIGPGRPGFSQLTPLGLTATATYYHAADVLRQIAVLLNRKEDAAAYTKLAGEIKQAFNKKFFNDTTNQYGSGSQTSNAMALYMGLVQAKNRQAVTDNLVKDIRSRNNALTAGDIGFKYVLKALDAAGRSDIIFDMNNRSDVPGYGYQLAKGATALTESWQALPSVSNNHFMLGHIMEWFYEGLAGISQSGGSVGYKNIVIRPQVVGDITQAKATYQSPYGNIISDWKKTTDGFELSTTIPANATAMVYLPIIANAVITENGKPVKASLFKDGKAIIKVGSGNYHFLVK